MTGRVLAAYLRPDLVLAAILAPLAAVAIVLAVILLGSNQTANRLSRHMGRRAAGARLCG